MAEPDRVHGTAWQLWYSDTFDADCRIDRPEAAGEILSLAETSADAGEFLARLTR